MGTLIHLDPHEHAIAGDEPPYHRTASDNRVRAIFWLVVMPAFYIGLGILGWAVGTALRQWLGF